MSLIAASSKAWGSQRRQLARLSTPRRSPVLLSLSHPSRDYKNRYLITHLASLSRRVSRYLSRNKLDRSRVVFSRRRLSLPLGNVTATASSDPIDDEDGANDFVSWKTPSSNSNNNNVFSFPGTPSSSSSSSFPVTPLTSKHTIPTSARDSVFYTLSSSTPSSSTSSSSFGPLFTPATSYTNTSPSSTFLASSSPSSPFLSLEKSTPTGSSQQFSKRLSDFVASHSPFYAATSESRKDLRIRKFLNECKTTRNQIFNIRRGYWVCGLGNEQINLGNELHISESQDRRLDRDRDQSSGPPCNKVYKVQLPKHTSMTPSPSLESLSSFTHALAYSPPPCICPLPSPSSPLSSSSTSANIAGPTVDCNIVTIQGQKLLKSSSYHHSKFNQADRIVQETFLQRGIDADLSFVVDRGFSVDMCVVREEDNIRDNSVLGCAMYVMMRNYVWVEEIAVKENWRSCGVGTALVDRLKQVSIHRGKDILLYALASAIPFYTARGFVQLDRWNAELKNFEGQYMLWSPQNNLP